MSKNNIFIYMLNYLDDIMKEVKVLEYPACDFCGDLALYDGKTILGPWAYMCPDCFKEYGIGIGLGMGQRLVVD